MPPAFDTSRQAAAFALLLLLLLASPWLADKTFLPGREQTYSSQSIRWEEFPWVQKFIFEETNDIDIAFVGSSHIAVGIDTPYVQQQLDQKLGRHTVVRTVGWSTSGFDSLYFFTKELLAHRHVNTIVFYDECSGGIPYEVNKYSALWFRFGEGAGVVGGLPWRVQANYYYAAIIGIPRNLLELLSANLPTVPNEQLTGGLAFLRSPNPEMNLGCYRVHLGFHDFSTDLNTNFVPFIPPPLANPADIQKFNPANAARFKFSDKPLAASQIYFARQFARLAESHGCHLVELHLPLFEDRASPVINESRDWAALMAAPVKLVGIPEKQLFSGLSGAEIKLLFYDPGHFNVNGQRYFTTLVTPALLHVYENHSQP